MIQRSDVEPFIPQSGEHFDVIVAGGGPAGIGAAVASAMNGAKTLLLEGRGSFGGIASLALWMPLNRMYRNGGSRGGVHQKLLDVLEGLSPDSFRKGRTDWINGDNAHIHPDYLRLATYRLLESVGCHYRLHTPVTGAVVENGTVKAVVSNNKSGEEIFYADVFVDCTGDGDIAYFSGAEMVKGSEEDGRFMPVSLVFAVDNVDTDRFFHAYNDPANGSFEWVWEDALESGKYAVSVFYSFDPTTVPGVLSVNNGGLRGIGVIDASDTAQINISERTGIEVAADFVRIAHDYKIPGLEECRLVRTGACVGVRETRRIVGEYVFTLDDAKQGKEFPDVISRKYGAVDPGGLGFDENLREVMKSGVGVPYRSLVPIKMDGLLVAGRCASATQLGQAAGKSMGNMMDMGQAAGVAAALCAAQKVRPRDLDVKQVQTILQEKMGVCLL